VTQAEKAIRIYQYYEAHKNRHLGSDRGNQL